MINFLDRILLLTKKLYPTGWAWRMIENGWLETLHKGLSYSENKAYNFALSIHNSILPDNDNFTADDATEWEIRLGMVVSTAPLSNRKLAIKRKINHPGTIKARQHYLYVQGQLQAAGFDVYVHENKFWDGTNWITKTPKDVSSFYSAFIQTQHADLLQHGGLVQHGGSTWNNKVVNSIYNFIDLYFNEGSNLRSTFFIGGATVGDYVNIPANREVEFRKLVLTLKPTQTVAYLFINYI